MRVQAYDATRDANVAATVDLVDSDGPRKRYRVQVEGAPRAVTVTYDLNRETATCPSKTCAAAGQSRLSCVHAKAVHEHRVEVCK